MSSSLMGKWLFWRPKWKENVLNREMQLALLTFISCKARRYALDLVDWISDTAYCIWSVI